MEHAGEPWELGTAESRVVGLAGRAYAAPDLIYHHVTAHGYRPPDEFIAAALAGPLPATPGYGAASQQYSWEELDPKSRALWVEWVKERQRQG